MKIILIICAVILSLVLLLIIAGQLGFLMGKTPQNIGVINGQLMPPSNTPNSVSSQAKLYPDHPQREYAQISPLEFSGDADQAMKKLSSILMGLERTVVVKSDPEYIYVQSTTKILKFTDDVEFLLDRTNMVIHVRSASRIGRKDLGVNRARIEMIREKFRL